MDVEKIVYEELSTLTGLKPDELTGLCEENLFEAGILDSLSLMALLTAVKDRLGCTVNLRDHTAKDFSTIPSIIGIVSRAL